MQLDDLNVLAAFLAVAEERSFTRAAKRVGVSRSALSHAVRGLEERVGVRLLSRTTRSVAPTDAGEQLLGRLRPALGDVASVLDHIAERRERPARHHQFERVDRLHGVDVEPLARDPILRSRVSR